MSKKDKLIDKLMRKPKDFTFDEMVSLLSYFGYELKQAETRWNRIWSQIHQKW